MTTTCRRIVLASRPAGPATLENFRLEEVPVPAPGPGQVLVRNHYLSLDPYMRGRMEESKSYAPPQPLGETMVGSTVGVVEASNLAAFPVGSTVLTRTGWQEYGIGDERSLLRRSTRGCSRCRSTSALSACRASRRGTGCGRLCEPKAGETVLVSAASGAVGSVVGQLAKASGCRAIGIAGGREKCDYVVRRTRLRCLPRPPRASATWDSMTPRECAEGRRPQGIDCVFENVGGIGLDAALAGMQPVRPDRALRHHRRVRRTADPDPQRAPAAQ